VGRERQRERERERERERFLRWFVRKGGGRLDANNQGKYFGYREK
jgi:hypothetical protein